jgi:hypothetical protein
MPNTTPPPGYELDPPQGGLREVAVPVPEFVDNLREAFRDTTPRRQFYEGSKPPPAPPQGYILDKPTPKQVSPSVNVSAPSTSAKVFNYFLAKGMQPHHVAGMVGSLAQESQLSPTAINPASKAFGIGQWLGVRKNALFAFAKATGRDPNDLRTQLDFKWQELNGPEKNSLKQILATTNAADAAVAHRTYYERPGKDEAHDEKRIAFANKILKTVKPGGIKTASIPTPPPGYRLD